MPELINPVTGGTVTVSDEQAEGFISRGFRATGAEPEAEPEADKPKRGRPRKTDGD